MQVNFRLPRVSAASSSVTVPAIGTFVMSCWRETCHKDSDDKNDAISKPLIFVIRLQANRQLTHQHYTTLVCCNSAAELVYPSKPKNESKNREKEATEGAV